MVYLFPRILSFPFSQKRKDSGNNGGCFNPTYSRPWIRDFLELLISFEFTIIVNFILMFTAKLINYTLKWRMIIAVNFPILTIGRKKPEKRESNPWPPWYRWDARPTELWSQTLEARSFCWVHIFPCSEMMWLLPSNCLNWKIYCDCDNQSSLSSTTAVQYEFHIYISQNYTLQSLENITQDLW